MSNTILVVAAFLALIPGPAIASLDAALSPESRLWLEGDSTLHPYSSTATALGLELSFSSGAALPAAAAAGVPARLIVRVPVKGLKSAHKGLDKNLVEALKGADHPDIVFTLTAYRAEAGRVSADGVLEVAGSTRAVSLAARLEPRDGRLLVEGEQPLKMTDFGIKPPKMMMGAIKTADLVTVKYRLLLETRKGDTP